MSSADTIPSSPRRESRKALVSFQSLARFSRRVYAGVRFDLVTFVPMTRREKRDRRYNQSELLCRGIAQTFGRRVNTTALVRHRYTRKQSRRKATERERNVSGAFSVRRPAELQGHHILLVDDVMTTGATLGSCGQALATVPCLRISVAALSVAAR